MKAITSFFKNFRPNISNAERAFIAYQNKEYPEMINVLKDMSATDFINDVRQDDINILHHCVMEDNFDAMNSLSALPYIRQVINDNSNEDGWTPLLSACARQEIVTNMDMVKLLVEHGADLC